MRARARILLLDDDPDTAKLLQKVLELRMFQVMTAGTRELVRWPAVEAVWLRVDADPSRDIQRLRRLGVEAPIPVSAHTAIPAQQASADKSQQKLVRIPFGLKLNELEAHLVRALELPARDARDPLGLGMEERVFMTVFDTAERHFLREFVRAHRANELRSAERLKEVADIEDFHPRMSKLRKKAWLFGIRIATFGDEYGLQLADE